MPFRRRSLVGSILHVLAVVIAMSGAMLVSLAPLAAQQPPPAAAPPRAEQPAVTTPAPAPAPAQDGAAAAPFGNTTLVPRIPADAGGTGASQLAQVKLVALLTSDGQRIDKGIVWRVFEDKPPRDSKLKMISTVREPTPTLKLPPGDYLVNASFGRAHLTR